MAVPYEPRTCFLRLRLLRFSCFSSVPRDRVQPLKEGRDNARNSCMGQTDPLSGHPLRQVPFCLPRYTTPQRAVPPYLEDTPPLLSYRRVTTPHVQLRADSVALPLGRGKCPPLCRTRTPRGWPPLRAPAADPGSDPRERPRGRCSLHPLNPKPINLKMRQNPPAAGRTTTRTPDLPRIHSHDHPQRSTQLLWPTCRSSRAVREHAAPTPPFRNPQTTTLTAHRS
jgi:hypothetical protein